MRKIFKILICVNLCNLWFIICPAATQVLPMKDSTKQQYALNDPRNPDCPCHKYQKLAEEEYNELLKKGGKGNHSKYMSKNKHHYKSLIELFFIRKKGIRNNHIKTQKHKRRNNLCYKF